MAVKACVDEAQNICGKHGSHGMVMPLVLRPCSTGVAVPAPTNNVDLVADCEALLESKLILEGSGTALNWRVDTAITSWHGVTVSSTPSRVTGLDLANHGIRGGAAVALAELTKLNTLRLGAGLTVNCLPRQLRNAIRDRTITTDLGANLSVCATPGRPRNLTSTQTRVSVSLSWDAPTDAAAVVGYRIKRKAPPGALVTIGYNAGSTATTYVDTGVEPGTEYIYRVIPVNAVGEEGTMSLPRKVETHPEAES